MKNLVLIDSMEGSEVWAVEGYTLGDPAVRVSWGYATGSEPGVHNVANTFAIAELGKVGEGGFESVVWTEKNLGKEIKTRRVIGWPQDYEGWDPDDDMEDVDWDAMAEWVEDYCQRML